jgi:hypothetical protein
MSHPESPHKHKLPVTAEVGGEGGSYADPTLQVATCEGDVPIVEEALTDAVPPDIVESDTREGILKFPTEK